MIWTSIEGKRAGEYVNPGAKNECDRFPVYSGANWLNYTSMSCENLSQTKTNNLNRSMNSREINKGFHKNDLRYFKIPPNSHWYPSDCKYGSDLYCSFVFCPLEQKIVDETYDEHNKNISAVNLEKTLNHSTNFSLNTMQHRIYDINILFQNENVFNSTSILNCAPSSPKIQGNDGLNPSNKPTLSQLKRIQNVLSDTVPHLFYKPLDYTIYRPDIVFENRIRGTVTQGLPSYVKQVLFLRVLGHLKFTNVRFEILNITSHPEEGTVCMRWRILGMSGLKTFLKFMKSLKWREEIDNAESWYDGFSTFYVGGDGLVHKHVVDIIMQDRDVENTSNKGLTATLAAIFGLTVGSEASTVHIGFDLAKLLQMEKDDEVCSPVLVPLKD